MHRRRLMHPAGNRLEVSNVERKWPEMTIPSDDVQRVVRVDVAGDLSPGLHAHFELAGFIVRDERIGRTNIALRIGSAFEKLSVVVDVAPRRLDVAAGALDHEHALIDAGVGHDSP